VTKRVANGNVRTPFSDHIGSSLCSRLFKSNRIVFQQSVMGTINPSGPHNWLAAKTRHSMRPFHHSRISHMDTASRYTLDEPLL